MKKHLIKFASHMQAIADNFTNKYKDISKKLIAGFVVFSLHHA